MSLLLTFLALVGSELYRAPTGDYPNATETQSVWVHFTDKGFRTQDQAELLLARRAMDLDERTLGRRFRSLERACDFDDLPPYERYIAFIEAMGGELRTRSAWLNAASFRAAPELIAKVAKLPFVYRIVPVAMRWEPLNEASHAVSDRTEGKRYRGEDTTGFKELYGLAYAQAKMLGVPQVNALGITGSGVRIGLLDTGLKRRHPAVKGIRVIAEHDFLSGDQLLLAAPNDTAPKMLDSLQGIGLIQEPVVLRNQDSVYVCYIADTVRYESPVRGMFAVTSFDNGATWSAPVSLYPPDLNSPSLHRPAISDKPGFVYVCWQSANRAEENPQIIGGYFQDGAWRGASMIQFGQSPSLFRRGDSLYLVSVSPDSSLWFSRASIAGGAPIWEVGGSKVAFNELVRDPCVVVADAGRIYAAVTGWRTGKVYLYRSTDAGETFEELVAPVEADAENAQLKFDGSFHLLFKDYRHKPLAGLSYLRSADAAQWTGSAVADSLLSVGSADFLPGSEIRIVYESEGRLYTRRSEENGSSWSARESLPGGDFARTPRWLDENRVVWVENGDRSTDVDPGDSLRFGRNQADHGTRMASIIAAFRRGSMVGIAPGAEFLIAKTEYHSFRQSNIGYEVLLEEDNYVAGMEWAERRGADIISSSLGYSTWYKPEDFDGKTAPISVAAGRAAARGLIVVTAMGNRDTTDPAHRWPNPYIVAPGDAFNVITVGGIEKNDSAWHTPGGGGTGAGPTADGRHKPDLVALGDSVTVVAPDSTGNVYEGSSGTSGATALIAGCCALVAEAHPEWTGPQIRDTLFAYANRSSNPGNVYGHGRPDVYAILKAYPPTAPTIRGDGIGAIFPNPYRPGSGQEVFFPILLSQPASWAELRVYSLAGELVDSTTLKGPRKVGSDKFLTAPGNYADKEYLRSIGALWTGTNARGQAVASGMYYAVLETGSGQAVKVFAVTR